MPVLAQKFHQIHAQYQSALLIPKSHLHVIAKSKVGQPLQRLSIDLAKRHVILTTNKVDVILTCQITTLPKLLVLYLDEGSCQPFIRSNDVP